MIKKVTANKTLRKLEVKPTYRDLRLQSCPRVFTVLQIEYHTEYNSMFFLDFKTNGRGIYAATLT